MKCYNRYITLIGAVLVIFLFLSIRMSCMPNFPDGYPEMPSPIELKCEKADSLVIIRTDLDTIISQLNENFTRIEKRNTDIVKERIEIFDSNITLWLAFIAAICTLLPMASAFYQATNISRELDELRKYIENEESKLDKQQKDFERKVKDYEIMLAQTEIISFLGTLVQSIRLICDMEDFRFKEKIVLADKEYLKKLVSGVEDVINAINSMANCCDEKLDNNSIPLIHSSITIAYRSLNDLLTIIESIAPDREIIKVIQDKDFIRNQFESFIKEEKTSINLKIQITKITSYTSNTMSILKNCIKYE